MKKIMMTRLSVCSLGVSCNDMIDTPMLLIVILNTFRVMINLRLLLLLTNLHLKLLSTQGTGADKLLST